MTDSLGVDIGGTKIQFCRVDPSMRAVSLGRTPTALLRRGTKAFAADLAALIRSVKPPGCDRVGVSLNCVMDGGTAVYSSLMGGRVDFPLEQFLTEHLGCPVTVDDDIHAMTLAEALVGAGRGVRSMTMLNLGTGIGAGCYAGSVLRGRFAAGLISEQLIYVEELGEWRSLDRTVCGRGVREVYAQLGGDQADAITVFARAKLEDARAKKTVGIFARSLGHVLQLLSRFYHPELIVLSGSIRLAASDYLEVALDAYRSGLGEPFTAQVVLSALQHAAEIGTLIKRSQSGTS